MAAPRDTVVLDRANFEVLVQRAKAVTDYQLGRNHTLVEMSPLMCLPMDEYEDLVLSYRKHANLVRRLMQEGLAEEHLEALSQDDPHGPQASKVTPDIVPRPVRSNSYIAPHKRKEDYVHSSDSPATSRPTPLGIQLQSKEPWRHDTDGNRGLVSLYFKGIAPGCTYWDVTSAIRGGALAHMRLVPATEEGFVSFVKEEEAMSFYSHVRKNELYIKNRRINVTWARHQRYTNGEVAAQIRRGASRNLVITDCERKITEREIRDDLEHIDMLVIIKVIFLNGHCHIKTSSIFDALVAKMCMQSRRKYKPWTIQWDRDECSAPYDEPQESRPTKQETGTPKEKVAGSRGHNRFASLRSDDDDNA
ncbi:uncharacterized protein F4812DRAFT_441197 [Daldinia caldariorum]|uniref:uncharacterized protein n=1 Tax=Daldinia caldariorum TaxID=326644 RepID=UPI0020074077|nr:uncharacterized protein F4812DRAFT_441197 [Daldinia caldariorum]KAI1464983.1 hypothetical protein F4812DRAFT_441197 [Daldinia caldariorum]